MVDLQRDDLVIQTPSRSVQTSNVRHPLLPAQGVRTSEEELSAWLVEPHVFACLQVGVGLDPSAGIREISDGLYDSCNAQSVKHEGLEECLVENSC